MAEYLRFVGLIKKEMYGALFGIFMSFIATMSSIGLMASATWFLSAMAVYGFYDIVLNIFVPSALIRLLAVSRTLLRYGERYYTHDATFRLIAYLRVFLFERALDLKIEDALKLKSSDIQRRMQSDVERLELIYIKQFVPFVVAVLTGMVVGAFLLWYSLLMAVTAIALMLLAGVIIPIIMTMLAKEHSLMQGTMAVRLNDEMSDFIRGFFDLMLLGKQKQRAESFLATADKLALARSRIIFLDQLAQVFLMTLSEITLILLLVMSVPLVVAGQMTPSMMMMLSVGTMASYEVLVPLSGAFLNLPYVRHAAERVSTLLKITDENAELKPHSDKDETDTDYSTLAAQAAAGGTLSRFSSFNGPASSGPSIDADDTDISSTATSTQSQAKPAAIAAAPATQDAQAIEAAPAALGAAQGHQAAPAAQDAQAARDAQAAQAAALAAPVVHTVEFKDVSFSYQIGADQTLQVLNKTNLTFSTDKNYVIKAPSGRGKSTMVMLMTGLLYPHDGALYLDGRPYTSLKAREVRAAFSVALQDITLFSGTVFETFKQIKPRISRDEVMAALAVVELTDLIAQLPAGLDEWLGSTGLTISGGQARRLCLARALVAANAVPCEGMGTDNSKFIVLDEPGEGLDEAQEERIIERIQNLRKGIIIITHKQAGSRLADTLINL